MRQILLKRMSVYCLFLSLAHVQHRQNTFTQNYFFYVLSNLSLKSFIIKIIENNILYRNFYF